MLDQKLKVIINKIAHRKENGWSILLTDYGKCIGVVEFEIEVNDCLELEGFFEDSDFDGSKQFKFTEALISFPTESRSLLKYAVEITIGLGPAKEIVIWEKYGESWESEDIDIKGLTDKIKENWKGTLTRIDKKREMVKVLTFIRRIGFSLKVAHAAWEKWEKTAPSMIKKNPYILSDLRGQSFQTVDAKIINSFENINQLYRWKSAIVYILNNKSNGDTVMTLDDIIYWLATYSIDADKYSLLQIFSDRGNAEFCWLEKFELVALGSIATDEIIIFNYFKGA